MTVKMSRKQLKTIQLLEDPQIVDFLYGGGAGGAKTITMCLWMLMECRNYPGIRIGLGRKEITRLKQTTVRTLIKEAHQLFGITESDFRYQEQKGEITYINDSSIQLVDLVRMPSDPDYDRLGSNNFTHVAIEEAGEIVKKAKDVFTSRKNRYLNDKYNIVGKSISTCNPSQNFLKDEYYKPYMEKGGGEFQKWEDGMVEVNGEMKPAYKAFIRSLATDNPFLPTNYIENLKRLPDAERKRLLLGDWNYADDDLMLFKSSLIDRCLIDHEPQGESYLGVDVADSGKDATVITHVRGNAIVNQQEITVDTNEPIGEQIAMGIIKYAQQNGIERHQASKIAIDTIGVGASTRDFMRARGWGITEFKAGGKSSSPTFRYLKHEVIYNLSQAMDKGEFLIYSKIKTLSDLRSQLMAHEYETEEKVIKIKQKNKIKEVLGRSPDHAESAYIAFWVSKGNNDPRTNKKRIIF